MERKVPPDNVPEPAFSRRGFLGSLSAGLGAAWLAGSPADLASASAFARRARARSLGFEVLSPDEVADIDAITERILPADDTPGARQLGAVYFVDRALATFDQAHLLDFRVGLSELRRVTRERHPEATSFATLDPAHQTGILEACETTPFFRAMREYTMMGCFGDPSYGGNRGKAGWKLIGFEDRFAWQAPFGHYDDPNGGPPG